LRKQIILLALCLVGVLVSVSSVTAADIYVNASAPAGGDGSSTNPFQNISAGINLATDGDTVNIADGTYTGTGNTQLTITKSMIITGQSQTGTIIDAEQNGRIFNIISGITVTIQNLTLQNGQSSESGGATLYNLGDLTLNNVTFKDNTATGTSSGGAICNVGNLIVTGSTFTGNTAGCGGAIFNVGTLNVIGSNFTNNNAIYINGAVYYGGGAVCNYGDLTVIDSNFNENTATNRDGGAIKNCGTIISISGCTFTGNTADSDGGAIFNEYGEVTCTSSDFTGNTANDGGAIYNGDGGTLACDNCDFTENIASYAGGAIVNMYNQFTCSGCNFTENSANRGGAIYNYEGVVTCTNCGFTGNTADFYGGAIYTDEESELTCTNCDFTENIASYYGGAIYSDEESEVTCTGCGFTENTANYSGGAIFAVEQSIVNCTSCIFTENSAENYYGGAIFADYESIVNCNSCDFTENSAVFDGGAIYNIGDSELTCTSCDFTENSAVFGGAIYNNFATATVIGSNLESNAVEDDGGAIYNNFGDFTLNFNRIVGNTAGRYGQDIYNKNNPENTINALYNWWGSNDGPAAGSIEYSQEDLVEYDPWLVMTYSADPTTIQQGSTSTLTADFRYDSDGTFHDPTLGHLPNGLPVTFTTDLGNVGSKSVVTYTLNGEATATLRGDEAAGEALISILLDNQPLTGIVTITPVAQAESATTTPGRAIGMQSTGIPLVTLLLAGLMILGNMIIPKRH